MDVEQQGARGIARVGRMHPAAAELPQQPAVDRAKGQLAARGALAGPGHMVEQPAQLGGREIRVQHQAGELAHARLRALLLQGLAKGRRAAVLPDQGAVQRLAGLAVPQHGGLALVGDADGHHLGVRCGQGLACAGELAGPDLAGIVLHPARLRVVLGQLTLGRGQQPAGSVEDESARTGSPLVQRKQCIHGVRSLRVVAWTILTLWWSVAASTARAWRVTLPAAAGACCWPSVTTWPRTPRRLPPSWCTAGCATWKPTSSRWLRKRCRNARCC
mmetsp:Transcript_11791/g.27714  ORF Transcript_11791/g.27714 Transcript_11791/m.27714 type:complete len:274 (-) Transcript_11791:1014-1835(-)